MITLSRKQVRTIRSVFRRALGVTSRTRGPAVAFLAAPDGLTLRAKEQAIAIERHIPGDFPPASFASRTRPSPSAKADAASR